jgi:hypothetical protein
MAVSIGSTANSGIPVLIAQRQVQSDQALLARDNAEMRRHQRQLEADLEDLAAARGKLQSVQESGESAALQSGLAKLPGEAPATQEEAPQPAQAAVPQTTVGQPDATAETIPKGKVIDVHA